MRNNYETHDFYCLNCGQKALPLMRERGHKHKQYHRKRLYCPYCRKDCNHIEIRSYDEKEWFLQAFANGDFIQEAIESIKECGG